MDLRARLAELEKFTSSSARCVCAHPHGECLTCGCPLLAEPLALQESDPVCPTCRIPWAGLERYIARHHDALALCRGFAARVEELEAEARERKENPDAAK